LESAGIRGLPEGKEIRQSAPYNLLVADDWMLLVPRLAEYYRGVSVNALAFAGSLFVKDRTQLGLIRAAGPMRVLTGVAGGR
jgi:ATP adenylyltransferase